MKKAVYVVAGTALLFALQSVAWAEEVAVPAAPAAPAAPEVKKELYGKWKRADTNQDGKVSYEEFRVLQEVKLRRLFDSLDSNHDGFVDAEEEFGDHEGTHHMASDDCAPGAKPDKAHDGKKKGY